jgi:hypothetical protein
MKDRNELTRDGDPLYDRGTIDPQEDEELDPPVDESDDGPQPVIIKSDDELQNANDEEER